MNRPINNNQSSIKHVTVDAIDDTQWWWIEHKVHSSRALNVVSLHYPGWGNGHPTRARRVDGEATSRKAPGNVRAERGGLTYCLSRYSLTPFLGDDFFCRIFRFLSTIFGSIAVNCFFSFVPFRDERGAIFGGGTRQGCSACNILCHFPWGVTVPVLQRTRSGDNPPPHLPLIGDRSGMLAHANATASPVRGSICLASPDLGGGGGIYISEHLWNPPLHEPPPGDERPMMNGGPFCILVRGGLLMDRCHPCHPPDCENMKAWDWIANGSSDPNEWSHSWAMRKPINSMEKTIIDGGNSEKRPSFLERKKTCLVRMKKENNAYSYSNKWMILYI